MVKIKVKKEFTKRELIKYLVEQDNIDVDFQNHQVEYHEGVITDVIEPRITGKFPINFNHDTKKIELYVEEEITEETQVPLLLEICEHFDDSGFTTYITEDGSIANNCDENSLAFYMLHTDGTLTLLWTKEGGMVE